MDCRPGGDFARRAAAVAFAGLAAWRCSSAAQPAFSVVGGHTAPPRGADIAAAAPVVAARTGVSLSNPLAPLAQLAGLAGCAALAVRGRNRKTRTQNAAYANAAQTYEGAPIGPPPDLPSLLLKNRIVYLGTPITNEVTELIIAQLLYLNYESADKPVTMYINSTGSSVKNSTRYIGEQKVGMETDAFAIADCMQYIKPKIMTIGIGQAYGTAATLLGLGEKGKRFALPNANIMLAEPREPPARGPRQAADIRIMAREVLQSRRTMAELLSVATGKTQDQIVADTQRCYYLTPEEAVTYNLIDKVLTPEKLKEQGQELPDFAKNL